MTEREIAERISVAVEPFIVPDVCLPGETRAEAFHILRDMVDAGTLRHDAKGYWVVR